MYCIFTSEKSTIFCSLKACFGILDQNDLHIQEAIYTCHSGACVFQVFTEMLPCHLSETVAIGDMDWSTYYSLNDYTEELLEI